MDGHVTSTWFRWRPDVAFTALSADEVLAGAASSDELRLLTGPLAVIASDLQAGGRTAEDVAATTGLDANEVEDLLGELAESGCVTVEGGLSRRSVLRRAGLVGVGVAAAPLIETILLPHAAAAFSVVNNRKTWTFQLSIMLGTPTNNSNPIDSFYLLRGTGKIVQGLDEAISPQKADQLTTSGGSYTAAGSYRFTPPLLSAPASLVGMGGASVRMTPAVTPHAALVPAIARQAVAVGWLAAANGIGYKVTGSFKLVAAASPAPKVRLLTSRAPGANKTLDPSAAAGPLTPLVLGGAAGQTATVGGATFNAVFTATSPNATTLYLIIDAANSEAQVDVTLRIQEP